MAKKKVNEVIENIVEEIAVVEVVEDVVIEETKIEEVKEQSLKSSVVQLDVYVNCPIPVLSEATRVEITNLGAGDVIVIETKDNEQVHTTVTVENTLNVTNLQGIMLLAACRPMVKIEQFGR